jgi:Domain of unknown function (DUF202)
MSVEADDHRGTQLERTVLSWNRIAIGVAANGALLLRAGFIHDFVALDAFGLAVSIIGFVIWALSLRRYSTIAERPAFHLFGEGTAAIAFLAAFVLLLSLVDTTVVIFVR